MAGGRQATRVCGERREGGLDKLGRASEARDERRPARFRCRSAPNHAAPAASSRLHHAPILVSSAASRPEPGSVRTNEVIFYSTVRLGRVGARAQWRLASKAKPPESRRRAAWRERLARRLCWRRCARHACPRATARALRPAVRACDATPPRGASCRCIRSCSARAPAASSCLTGSRAAGCGIFVQHPGPARPIARDMWRARTQLLAEPRGASSPGAGGGRCAVALHAGRACFPHALRRAPC